MTSIPDTQKAWVAVRKGVPSVALEFKQDWPVSKNLKKGEILVKIQAAGLNPIGYKVVNLLPNFADRRPRVTENDFSGVVVDANDSEYAVGDEVYGWVSWAQDQLVTREGALAEYIRCPAVNVIKRPSNITPIQAAGITLVGLTAYQGLKAANLEAGQSIFINGGSTAVGSFAIQMAKAKGCKVTVAASGKNEAYVRSLGADEFVDYTKVGPLHEYLANNPPSAKYNVFLEAVALIDPSLYTQSERYLAPNGIYVTVGPQAPLNLKSIWQFLKWLGLFTFPTFLTGVKPKCSMIAVHNDQNDMQAIQKLLEEGTLKPLVDSVHEFEDALEAYARIKTGRATGKVIVKIDKSLA